MPRSNNRILCLGVESTAHTFGASIVDSEGRILTNENSVYNAPTGVGIHPRKAAEHHVEVAAEVVGRSLKNGSGSGELEPDIVAYSAGPGLGPCLRIGATVARSISSFLAKPLVPVHHGIAHIDLAMKLARVRDPLAVLVSGGHSAILVHTGKRWIFYGETQDITLGNLFDMFARKAELASPGGPSVEAEAKKGEKLLSLPYTVKGNDVAYSGLLTAAVQLLRKGQQISDICYSIQEVAFSMLSEAVERSLVQTRKQELLVAGGVAANKRLREMLGKVAEDHGVEFGTIPFSYSGDCGAQIAMSGQLAYRATGSIPVSKSYVIPRWRLDEVQVPWVPHT